MQKHGTHILKFITAVLCFSSSYAFGDGCASDFNAASGLFKEALGADAPIEKIPKFSNQITVGGMKMTTENTITKKGDDVWVTIKVTMLGMNVEAPIKVCKDGAKLTASLIMSQAVLKKAKAPDELLQAKVPSVPDEIVIHIARGEGKNVNFVNETFKDSPPATATVK